MKLTIACVLLLTGCTAPPLPAVANPLEAPKPLGRVLFKSDPYRRPPGGRPSEHGHADVD